MSLGNNQLAAIPRLYASVVAKPGGLRKQQVKRWNIGMGTGPSYDLTRSVMREVGKDHLKGIQAYNLAREQHAVSHANLPAKWLLSPRKPAARDTAAQSRVKMRVLLTLLENSGVRVDLLRNKLLEKSSGESMMLEEIAFVVEKALFWLPPPRTTDVDVFETFLWNFQPKLLTSVSGEERAAKVRSLFDNLAAAERTKHISQAAALNSEADTLLTEWQQGNPCFLLLCVM